MRISQNGVRDSANFIRFCFEKRKERGSNFVLLHLEIKETKLVKIISFVFEHPLCSRDDNIEFDNTDFETIINL